VQPNASRARRVVTDFTDLQGKQVTKLYLSEDCGETWKLQNRSSFNVRDLAWSERNGVPLLYMATDGGLWELLLASEADRASVCHGQGGQASRLWSPTRMCAAWST